MDRVSIIVPVYNNENYILKCMNSLLNQTYSNIEIIVVDDGSTDSTYEVLKQYQNEIIILHQDNHGVSYSRNRGMEVATGTYIMFVDSDDWIAPDMVETLMKMTENGSIDIVRCGYIREYPKHKDTFQICTENLKIIDNKNIIYEMFIKDYRLASPCCQVIHKKCIETKFDETIQVGEDYLFNLALYTHASSFVFLKDAYYHYLYNFESATTSVGRKKIEKRCEDALLVYSKLYDYLKIWKIENKKNIQKVSYRIVKELNMKLLACFQNHHMPKKEQKKLMDIYFHHVLLKEARKKLSVAMILKYFHIYTLFLLCLKMNLKNLYYILGRTIYYTLYSIKK